jgi:hypothetical protein
LLVVGIKLAICGAPKHFPATHLPAHHSGLPACLPPRCAACPGRLVIFTLFFKEGNDMSPDNLPTIASVLFMWTLLPAFGAASYVPAIVMERPLFVR